MERLLDQLIGHMRTVVVAGVNVVHAGLHHLAKNGDGGVNVAWRSPDSWPSKLHCAVAHAVHRHRCARQREGAGEIRLCNHFVPPCFIQ